MNITLPLHLIEELSYTHPAEFEAIMQLLLRFENMSPDMILSYDTARLADYHFIAADIYNYLVELIKEEQESELKQELELEQESEPEPEQEPDREAAPAHATTTGPSSRNAPVHHHTVKKRRRHHKNARRRVTQAKFPAPRSSPPGPQLIYTPTQRAP